VSSLSEVRSQAGKLPAKQSRRSQLFPAHFLPTVQVTLSENRISECQPSTAVQASHLETCFWTHNQVVLEQWKFPAEYFLSVLLVNEYYSHTLYLLVCPMNKSQQGQEVRWAGRTQLFSWRIHTVISCVCVCMCAHARVHVCEWCVGHSIVLHEMPVHFSVFSLLIKKALIFHNVGNLLFYQRQIGPFILRALTAHHTSTLKLCTSTLQTACEFSVTVIKYFDFMWTTVGSARKLQFFRKKQITCQLQISKLWVLW
jgi:hypothetical protein